MGEFSVDIERIRKNAEQDIQAGAVVPEYKANREQILKMLDHALATEWVCVLRYQQNAQMAEGIYSESVAQEFWEHAAEEQAHAEKLSARIKQLGGRPDLNPATLLSRSHARYKEGESVAEMLKDNLIAERMVIGIYGDMIRYIGDSDPTTRRLFEEILAQEEEHADDLAGLLASFDPRDRIAS